MKVPGTDVALAVAAIVVTIGSMIYVVVQFWPAS